MATCKLDSSKALAMGIILLLLPMLSTVAEAESGYPSAQEARAAFEWLEPQMLNWINGHAGWAIDGLSPTPRPLPPGVLAQPLLTPGWATFGLALPQKAASGGLQVGSLETQTNVKTRWPDGSIRFAVVTASVPQTGIYNIRAAQSSSGTFNPQVPSGLQVVLNTDYGATFTASLPPNPTADIWLSGPLVREWRAVVIPTDSSSSPHPFLRVIFDFRTYNDSESRFDVTVENVLDTASATAETYDLEISAGGNLLFEYTNLTHWYLTRWRKIFGLDLAESYVEPDFETFHRAQALPRYLSSVDNDTRSMEGPDFELLGKGGNSYTSMGTTGGRPELACYPDSTAQYLVHRTDNQRQFLLVNGDLAGSWPVHIRETDGSLVSIADRPSFWLDSRGSDKPAGNLTGNGIGPLRPDNAHQPSWAYVPYLMTGDRYYADEMAFWANYVMLRTWPYRRGGEGAGGFGDDGSWGLLGPGNQTRGFAWGFRNLVDAAAYLPDSHQNKSYFEERAQNNLDWADFWDMSFDPPGTGAYFIYFSTESGMISLWQHDYLGWSIDHAHQQGFSGGYGFKSGLSGFQSKLFVSEPDYLRDYAAPYRFNVGIPDGAGGVTFHQTMAELFEHNNEDPSSWNRDYAAGARLMLMIQAGPTIFDDDFESGDTSRWTFAH